MSLSHALTPSTTLGVGISAPGVYSFHEMPKDYTDFTQMYSRWLAGPTKITPAMSLAEQRAERALNYRVFGKAEPTLSDLERQGWYPNQHPGPLGLWNVQRIDFTGIPEAADSTLLNQARQAAQQVAAGITDVKLPKSWSQRIFDALRPEALRERTLSEVWARNVITDNGATAMLKNTWNSAGSTVTIMDYLQIAYGNQAYAVQTGSAITNGSGAQTSIACSGGVQAANFGASVSITWSYGTSSAETCTTGTGTPGNVGATSITITSHTTTSGNTHSAGDFIVNQPTTSDNPSSLSNSASSGALSSGAFTFSGSGAGNRQVAIAYTYATSTTAGAYTECYTCNASSVASNSTASHLIFPPQTINSSTSLALTVTEKC